MRVAAAGGKMLRKQFGIAFADSGGTPCEQSVSENDDASHGASVIEALLTKPPHHPRMTARASRGLVVQFFMFGLLCGSTPARADSEVAGTSDTSGGRSYAVRLQMDWSYWSGRAGVQGEVDTPGTSTLFYNIDGRDGHAIGGAVEVGPVFELGRGMAMVLYGSFAMSRMQNQNVSAEVAGIEHVFRSRPWTWSLGPTAEYQFYSRTVGVMLGVGFMELCDAPQGISPDGLEAEGTTGGFGLYARLGLILRAPADWAVPLGITTSVDVLRFVSDDWRHVPVDGGWRAGLGVLVEWDRTRK